MSARDEYELVDATSDTVTLTGDDFDAAMDRIDTLTAENATLRATVDAQLMSNQIGWQATLSDLRSLRAAVAEVSRTNDDPGACLEDQIAAQDALLALVPSDGSWETEQ